MIVNVRERVLEKQLIFVDVDETERVAAAIGHGLLEAHATAQVKPDDLLRPRIEVEHVLVHVDEEDQVGRGDAELDLHLSIVDAEQHQCLGIVQREYELVRGCEMNDPSRAVCDEEEAKLADVLHCRLGVNVHDVLVGAVDLLGIHGQVLQSLLDAQAGLASVRQLAAVEQSQLAARACIRLHFFDVDEQLVFVVTAHDATLARRRRVQTKRNEGALHWRRRFRRVVVDPQGAVAF